MTPLQPTDIVTGSESRHQGRVLEFLENSSFGPPRGGKRIDPHASQRSLACLPMPNRASGGDKMMRTGVVKTVPPAQGPRLSADLK